MRKVDEVGAGMSACWLDFDNDGKQDIYVADMWSPRACAFLASHIFTIKIPKRFARFTGAT